MLQFEIINQWSQIATGPITLQVSSTEEFQIGINETLPSEAVSGFFVSPNVPMSVYVEAGKNLYLKCKSSDTTAYVNIIQNGYVNRAVSQVKNYDIEASIGNIEGVSNQFKFFRSTVGNSPVVLWDNNTNYTWITAAEILKISSSDANDTALGTGARTLVIYGLDSDYNIQSEVVIMDGTTNVLTVNAYLRVYRALVLTNGTDSAIVSNIGTISVSGNTTDTLLAKILPNNGQSLMSQYTIPADTTGFITGSAYSTGQGFQCTLFFMIRNAPQAQNGAFSVKFAIDLYQNSFFGENSKASAIPEKTDMCVIGSTTQTSADISGSYGIALYKNSSQQLVIP